MKNYKEFEVRSYEQSTWFNPTKKSMTLRVWAGPETSREPWLYLTVPPGEERPFPAKYDPAIHKINEHGVIIGGAAPLLRKKNAPYNLHPDLDTDLQEQQIAIAQAKLELDKINVAEKATAILAVKMKTAELALEAENKVKEQIALDKKAVKDLQEKMIDERVAAKAGK